MVFGQDLGLADGLEGVAPEDRLTPHHRIRSGVGRGGGVGWEEKFGEKNNFLSSQEDPKKFTKCKLQIANSQDEESEPPWSLQQNHGCGKSKKL